MMNTVLNCFKRTLAIMFLTALVSSALPGIFGNPAQAENDNNAVLASNAEFYRAFRESDMPAMENIWSSSAEVAVVHPGWPKLTGLGDVLESWQRILQNPNSPKIRCVNELVEFRDGLGIVTCDELVNDSVIRAINVFKENAGKWKMIFHGAAATPSSRT